LDVEGAKDALNVHGWFFSWCKGNVLGTKTRAYKTLTISYL